MNRRWLPNIPLPSHWPEHAQTALLHAIALAHFGLTHIRGWCENSRIERVKLKGQAERALSEVALLREEMHIKDARMGRLPAANRPHYLPTERMAILELKTARAWNNAQTARAFLVTEATTTSWLRRLDEQGPDALVQTPSPVNKFPDFVAHLVKQLKATLPAMGKVRVAQMLARAGLQLSATTVGRMARVSSPAGPSPADGRVELEPDAHPGIARGPTPAAGSGVATTETPAASGRTVTANYSDHAWNIDLSLVPTGSGFCAPWLPSRALPQCWPFAWWVVAIVDHHSRKVMDIDAYFSEPSAADVCALLDRAVASAGRAPRYTVTDQGGQFREEYRAWCKDNDVKPRFGAVGKHGSIALIERFILSLKNECTRRIQVPLRLADMRTELSLYSRWYCEHRPHQSRGGRTPSEVYEIGKIDPFRIRAANDSRVRDPPRPRSVPSDLPRLELRVSFLEGRRHLPIVELERAA